MQIKILDNQLASSLLTTCSRPFIIEPEQAMRTHPDICLMTAEQQACSRFAATFVLLAVWFSRKPIDLLIYIFFSAFSLKVEDLEEQNRITAKQNEELMAANDTPDGASTPLDNSLDGSRASLSRTGRASALERLDTLEDENIQLLNRQAELEDELDAAEEHAEELKSALKAKRENVNELHAEMDILKERMKSSEKSKAELADENEQLQQTCLLSKQKVEDLRAVNERYIQEFDETEKALTMAEQRVNELERRFEEVSG